MADELVQNHWQKVTEAGLTHFVQLEVAQQWLKNVVSWTEPSVIADLDSITGKPDAWIKQGRWLARIGQALQFGFRSLDVPVSTYPVYRDIWQKQFVGVPGYGLTTSQQDAVDYGKYNSTHRFLPYDLKIVSNHYPCDGSDTVLRLQGATGINAPSLVFGVYRTLVHSMWKRLKPNDKQRVWIPPRAFLNAQSYFDFQGVRYSSGSEYSNGPPGNPMAAQQANALSRDAQYRYFDWLDDPFILGEQEQASYPNGDGGPWRNYEESDRFDLNMGVFAPVANEYYDSDLRRVDGNDPDQRNRWDVWGVGRPGWFQIADCDTIPLFWPAKWMISPFRSVAQAALSRGMMGVVADSHAYAVLRNMKVSKQYFGTADAPGLYAASQAAKFDAVSAKFEPDKTINIIAKVTQAAGVGVGAIPTPPTMVAGLILGVVGKTIDAINSLSNTGGGFNKNIEDDMFRPKPVFEKITLTGTPSYLGEGDPPLHSVPLPQGMTQEQRDALAITKPDSVTTNSLPHNPSDAGAKKHITKNLQSPMPALVTVLIGTAILGTAVVVAWKLTR